MTSEQLPPSRRFSVALPRHTGLMVGGAFVLGLLGFVLVQSLDRDKAFYRGQSSEVADASSIPLAPLPTPLAAGGSTQLPDLPRAEGGERPHLVEPVPAPIEETAPAADGTAPLAANDTPAAEAAPQVLDSPPQRIAEQSPAPDYPTNALRRGRSGVVVLNVQVDATGRPARVRVVQRSGTRELDRAAMQAVERWRFQPAMANGQPVPGEVEVPIEFSP